MSIPAAVASLIHRWLPVLNWTSAYQREWLLPDFFAGLALWAVMVPEGMAYAGIVGVPPIMGLYTTVPALTAYVTCAICSSEAAGHYDRYDCFCCRVDTGRDAGHRLGGRIITAYVDLLNDPPTHFSAVNYIDISACDELISFIKELKNQRVTVAFARVRDPVRQRMQLGKIEAVVGPTNFHERITDGVTAWQRRGSDKLD
jgi:MFS superfamily sulfate permease-like transporter